MSVHFDLLEAALAAVQAIPAFAGVQVLLYKEPRWNSALGSARMAVVAPPADLAERLGGGTTPESFGAGADLVYDVFVGVVHPLQHDADALQWRIDRREDVRLALWSLAVAKAGGAYDVEYDPQGAGALRSGAPNVDESWQRFSYSASVARTHDARG